MRGALSRITRTNQLISRAERGTASRRVTMKVTAAKISSVRLTALMIAVTSFREA